MKPLTSILPAALSVLCCLQAADAAKPLKIYILAGQSNMLGAGMVSPATTRGTLEHVVANDPDQAYQSLVDGDGKWIVRRDVRIRDQGAKHGGLTVGYGAREHIGPELGFGHHVGDRLENPVLIIKAAWGGKSLGGDFRPPSSGGETGHYYKEILRLVREATSDLRAYVPDYRGQGFEIAGFAWHQGWNDRINKKFTAEYASNMANFIRDIRNDLGVPGLPFVIATTGMDGATRYTELELAQRSLADPETFPEFVGNVAVVDTRAGGFDGMDFWQDADLSPSSDGTHWNKNAKAYVNIGRAMADAMLVMAPGRCPFRLRAKGGANRVILNWKNGTEKPKSIRIFRDGVEIAADAPADPATFIDPNVQPGSYEYRVEFAMPGDPCPPLTTSFHGGVTDLASSPDPEGLKLMWRNNMDYDAIRVLRDGKVIAAALPGKNTTYVDAARPSTGLVTYSVAPVGGRAAPAALELNFNLRGELGILDLIARGGINPTTLKPWKTGDQYHLAFVSSTGMPATSQDLGAYDAFLQKLAGAAGIGGTWKVIGSSWTVDARRHTSTDPREDGEGVPIFLLDGSTIIANNYQDLWDSTLDAPINRDERGNPGLSGNVFTGSVANGAKDARPLGCSDGKRPTVAIGTLHSAGKHWMQIYGTSAAEPLPLYALSERLTVLDVCEATPPRLKSVVDDRRGQAVAADQSVTFAVAFDEPMKASTVDGSDFGNALPSAVTINSVSRTGDPAIFEIEVTPTEEGRLQLQIAPGAELQDLAGNAMDTSTAIRDDTTITVTPAPLLAGELGILDVTANGGINPATGKAWKAGDRYRLVFVTAANTRAASADLGTYDAFLQRVAGTAGIGGTWKVLGSSATVNARDHTSTHPDVNGNGEPIFLLDGVTRIAENYKDLWDGSLDAPINRNELGNGDLTGRVFTGSRADGTKDGRPLGGSTDARPSVTIGARDSAGGHWMCVYNAGASNALPIYALSHPLTVRRKGGK